ncbi:galactosylceramide sulfotransferase-like [Penaeus chinensis]|uniref:galactosylceramide sulfotransferase-like n=1 Tax=Penaeus chinensis TaxID=139456 RepID=UPI001FB6F669|nr:galactosylceramide sulfotransferase-like [Penaeus chinensis]
MFLQALKRRMICISDKRVLLLLSSTLWIIFWQMSFADTNEGGKASASSSRIDTSLGPRGDGSTPTPRAVGGACTPRPRVFFLKTHKCGSSTLQHLFLRYGKKHNLSFALPGSSNYLGSPGLFSPSMIPPRLRTQDGRFDMFLVHTRFHQGNAEKVMREGAAWVTMLREPASHFQSLWNFYGLQKHLKMNLSELLELPYAKANDKRRLHKFGLNMQMFDLGFDPTQVPSEDDLRAEFDRLNRRFDLVMILERFDESLVLLKHLLCWTTDDIAYLKINELGNRAKYNFTAEDKARVRALSTLDNALYDYFSKRFDDKVRHFGKTKMKWELEQLQKANDFLQRNCFGITKLKDAKVLTLCKDLKSKEKSFLNDMRRRQLEKIQKGLL